MADQEIVSTLNNLIRTCHDGEAGFRTAAEHLTDDSIKALFQEFAVERGRFADELADAVRRHGGTPAERGSISGAAHHGWMNIKGAVTGYTDSSIISEAERGEDVAVSTYRTALQQSLPPEIHALVARQSAGVKEVHDRVRVLEQVERT